MHRSGTRSRRRRRRRRRRRSGKLLRTYQQGAPLSGREEDSQIERAETPPRTRLPSVDPPATRAQALLLQLTMTRDVSLQAAEEAAPRQTTCPRWTVEKAEAEVRHRAREEAEGALCLKMPGEGALRTARRRSVEGRCLYDQDNPAYCSWRGWPRRRVRERAATGRPRSERETEEQAVCPEEKEAHYVQEGRGDCIEGCARQFPERADAKG